VAPLLIGWRSAAAAHLQRRRYGERAISQHDTRIAATSTHKEQCSRW